MDKEFESELLLQEESPDSSASPKFAFRRYHPQKRGCLVAFLGFLVIVLSTLNILQWKGLIYRSDNKDGLANRSQYAGLLNNEIKIQWTQPSALTSNNETDRDHEWDAIDYDNGVVAVPKEWAVEKGLPMGSSFPWDTNKAIYLVNAHHNLHCLKNIYRSLMEFRKGQPQSFSHHHIVHCLDELVSDVKCNADDTLRFTKVGAGKSTAMGQYRTCRNWDKLQEWTLENAGCYRYGNPDIEDHAKSQIPRYRFCPEGSKDLEHVREYFGKGKDWKPYEEKAWSWEEGWIPSESGIEDWVKPS